MKLDWEKLGYRKTMGEELLQRAFYEPIFKYRQAHGTESSDLDFVADLFSEKIIKEQALWYSDPFDFNDPFEFQFYFKRPSRARAKKYVNQERFSKQDKVRFLRGNQNMTDEHWQQFNEGTHKRFIKDMGIGVCCFSATPLNIPMWSYYAQEHSGFCLEFVQKSSNNCYFQEGIPLQVDYTDRLLIPVKDIFALKENKDQIPEDWLVMQTKSKQWAHEEEVRMIMLDRSNNRAVKYNKNALRSIIFGCRASSKTINHYTSLLQEHGFDHVKLKRAEKDFKEYKLNIVDL